MTYGLFKNVVKGLMLGDNNPPVDNNIYLGLLAYAFNVVGSSAESFHLLTLNRKKDLLRMASGDYFMRRPELPVNDLDELDIDEELCFATAEILCSLISDDRIHVVRAEELIRKYNEKVYQIFEEIKYDYRSQTAKFAGGRSYDDLTQTPMPIGVIE